MKNSLLIFALLFFVAACTPDKPNKPTTKPDKPKVEIPKFNKDSAYAYIQKQVDFGPRVPGTEEHLACANWLEQKLKDFGAKTYRQTATVTAFDGTQLPMYNIIGAYNPDAKDRLLLCAHWDTRPFADQDTERVDEPILGANDGGSGVGVLLELARIFNKNNPKKGIDIIFFDVEDYGKGAAETYCLGSQYWAKNPHIPNYTANAGILLDMVGAGDVIFHQEGYSVQYAKFLVDDIWYAANKAGFSSYFSFRKVQPITDDHLFINKIAKIPTIDIIQYDQNTSKGFGNFWHTHDDDMDIIDKNTLRAVGQTVLTYIYQD